MQFNSPCFPDVVDNFGAKINDGKWEKKLPVTECTIPFEFSDSDGWDTDLEEELFDRCNHHESTGVIFYKDACTRAGISPSRHIIDSLEQSVLSLRYKSCGSKEIKAMKEALCCNSTINVFDLEGNNIEEEGLLTVKQILDENIYITELNLAENNLGSAGAAILGDILKESKWLTTVSFRGNRLQDKDGHKIAEGISSNESVRILDLSHNEFRSLDRKTMREALNHNGTLYELDLSWNHLRLEGAAAIVDGIERNDSIETLNLAFNGFSDDGAAAMGKALVFNRTLTTLDLSYNRISNVGAKALSKGLMQNSALRALKIGFNPITSEGSLALLLAMKHVSTLEELWMDNICLNVDAVELAEAMIKERNGTIVVYGAVTKSAFNSNLYAGPGGEMRLKKDILDVLKQYLADKRLRMLDLFNQWDKDKSMHLTKKKFIIGLRSANIPLSTEMVSFLVNKFHGRSNDDGMSYSEFVAMLNLDY